MSRRTQTTGVRDMGRALQREIQRSDLERLEQQRVEHDTRMRKMAEATNTRDPGRGWVDMRH